MGAGEDLRCACESECIARGVVSCFLILFIKRSVFGILFIYVEGRDLVNLCWMYMAFCVGAGAFWAWVYIHGYNCVA
jgi:hypothetical protein